MRLITAAGQKFTFINGYPGRKRAPFEAMPDLNVLAFTDDKAKYARVYIYMKQKRSNFCVKASKYDTALGRGGGRGVMFQITLGRFLKKR